MPALIALTSGEPAGIGPDICIRLAAGHCPARLVFLGDPDVFAQRIQQIGTHCELALIDNMAAAAEHVPGRVQLLPVPLAAAAVPGQLDPANAAAVLRMLELAGRACLDGTAAAMVTAPVQKSVINEAGIAFSGHTEFLAELTGTPRVVMLLAGGDLRVALATTHLPLAQVPAAITRAGLTATLEIVEQDLRRKFDLSRPRILVLGLNPHAGENGVLGSEEQTTITPVVTQLRARGFDIRGPVAGDTAFTPESLAGIDVVVAMYHDQGLAPLKARHFGDTVNITLGLPIIRTSVDHGTALALAGTGNARHQSLRAALDAAIDLARRSA